MSLLAKANGLLGVGWMRGVATGREGPSLCPKLYAHWRNPQMAPRPNTAPLILSIVDSAGRPLELHGEANALIDEVAQAVRKAARAQHCDHAEAIAQIVAARLSVTWPQHYGQGYDLHAESA